MVNVTWENTMGKAQSGSPYRTLAIVAALAALGASAGVPEVALAQPSAGVQIAAYELYRVQKQGMRDGSKQGTGDGSVKQGAHPGTSMKDPGPPGRGGIGKRSLRGPGSSRMLNPQPLPPKGRLGTSGRGE
jgi:hypothetical protein